MISMILVAPSFSEAVGTNLGNADIKALKLVSDPGEMVFCH